ncbi:hypothetical protein DERF_006767 [Dermatophagoides farinae]|uniref:Uncharacterized protein n=1 Tax=Dermatophagoides farinae TaxID=6954 RepID=A0A922HZR6_DERFA|nr:hypothetical protein DERF_006767 [Dermatophagoides farinae]
MKYSMIAILKKKSMKQAITKPSSRERKKWIEKKKLKTKSDFPADKEEAKDNIGYSNKPRRRQQKKTRNLKIFSEQREFKVKAKKNQHIKVKVKY